MSGVVTLCASSRYTLVTSQGQTFRYTLFNESELGEDEQVVLDAVRQKEHELYEREQANLQNQVGTSHPSARPR